MPAYTDKPDVLREALTAVQFHEGGTFRPTLVIGLGGSGVNTARRLKRLLHERYQVRELILIGFLFVDADQGAYEQGTGLAQVEDSEKATIFVRNPDQLLDEYRKDENLHPYFRHILNDNLDVTMLRHADGAAGIRPVGRFAFHASFDVLYTHFFEPAVQHIMQVKALTEAIMQGVPQKVEITHSEPRIYLIGSLCGGTGSAIFMDTAIVIRHILEQNNLDGELVGVFYLPSVFRNESGISPSLMEVIEANAYAGLMELEHLCDPSRKQSWNFEYPVIGKLSLEADEPLLDEVFLVEGGNAEGKFLSNKYDAFEMTARSLLLDIGSPLGARARSARRNALAVIDTIPCAETKKPRLMNSLAVTSLAVPVQELLQYCAVRAAKEVFAQTSTGGALDLSNEIENFLRTNELDERGSSNQMRSALLKDADGNPIRYVPRSATEVLGEAEGAGHRDAPRKAQYSAEHLQRELQRLQQEWLPEQERTIKRNAANLLEKAKRVIGEHAEEILKAHGHDATTNFLDELIRIFETVCSQRVEEQKQMEEQVRNIEQNIDTCRENLQQRTKANWLSRWRVNDLQDTLRTGLDWIRSLAEQHLQSTAIQYLLKLLRAEEGIEGEEALLPTLKQWRELVQNWKTHQTRTDNFLDSELRRQTMPIRSGNGYDLEWLAFNQRDRDAFYRQLNIDQKRIREQWYKLRQKYPHEPAFGGLSSTHIDAEEEAKLRIAAAAEVLADEVKRKATILQIIRDKKQSGDADYILRKLQLLFDVCQPFWSTSDPPGEPRYEVYVAVSVPPSPENTNNTSQQLEEEVLSLCKQHGAKAELVPDGYPFALTLMKRTYGARAYYLRSSERMKHFYEKRCRDGVVKHRLHVDKRFFDLPKLHPVQVPQEVKELWAWGVAFGYIAQKGEKFVLGIQPGRGGAKLPKYASEWELVLSEHLPAEWKRQVHAHVSQEDVLGEGRVKAFEAFAGDKDKHHLLREARDYVERRILREPQSYIHLLDGYTLRLLDLLNAERDEPLRKLLEQERDALNRVANRIAEQNT